MVDCRCVMEHVKFLGSFLSIQLYRQARSDSADRWLHTPHRQLGSADRRRARWLDSADRLLDSAYRLQDSADRLLDNADGLFDRAVLSGRALIIRSFEWARIWQGIQVNSRPLYEFTVSRQNVPVNRQYNLMFILCQVTCRI